MLRDRGIGAVKAAKRKPFQILGTLIATALIVGVGITSFAGADSRSNLIELPVPSGCHIVGDHVECEPGGYTLDPPPGCFIQGNHVYCDFGGYGGYYGGYEEPNNGVPGQNLPGTKPPPACAALAGKAKVKCESTVRLNARLVACNKISKKSKKKLCIKKAKALAKCDLKAGKKKKACVKKAKSIGKKRKKK
jgi:hypothetical protein